MRKLVSIIALSWLALALAGCNGDSGTCSQLGGGGSSTNTTSANCNSTTATASTIQVGTSALTIPGDGTAVSIAALVGDAKGNPISGAAVSFSTTAGVLGAGTATTNSSGVATVSLTAKGVANATAIVVTGTTGSLSGKVTVTVGTGTTTGQQNSISVITSLAQIPSDGSKTATITALVRDTNNNLVSGVTVNFSATSGGLQVTQATTDATGSATATLSAASDPSDRTITVTASAEGQTATVPVSVVGTTLSITGPTTLIQGAQGTYSVTLTNSAGNGISNQTVTLASSAGNTLTPSSVTTNSSGTAQFQVTATKSGADTVTATSLGLTAQQTLAVSNQAFAFTAPAANTQVNIGQTATINVTWTSSGTAQSGQTVAFSATRGTLSASSATTSAQGVAQVTISSNTAGPSVISATGTGVSAQLTIDFVATTPATVAVQASPASISPQGQSTITATVRDANDNLVEGVWVDFNIVQDATGGTLAVASAQSNAQGQATTTYTASTTSSATNGVVISATVRNTTVTKTTSLTVAGQTTGLSMGTGVQITALSTTQYKMPWSVQAVDPAGHGVPNVPITFTVTSLSYLKGHWVGTTTWTWTPSVTADPDGVVYAGVYGCKSEDINNNGVLDTGEDYNGNGKLDPGLVVSTDIPSGTTDTNGSVTVNLIYPKDHALWVVVRLTATATVNGTESSTSTDIELPLLASDVPSSPSAGSPPGQVSPYGIAAACSNPN